MAPGGRRCGTTATCLFCQVRAPEDMQILTVSFHAPPQELARMKEAAAQAQGELERAERKCQAAAAEAQASSDAAARMRVRFGWNQGCKGLGEGG